MGYVAPRFALFTVLGAVPVLLHLFGRPRAEKKKFAALGFLLKSDRKTASQRRVRQLLLLIARVAAITLVPLILAKPYFETTSDVPTGIGSGHAESAVLVLDDSRSMGLRHGDSTLFDEARARALKLVANLGRDSEAAIVLVAAPPSRSPPPELTADRTRLRRALSEARVTHRPGDVTGALRRAAAILANAPQAERRVYLFSDLAAHGFSSDAPWPSGGPTLVPVDVTDNEALDNRAVVDLHIEGAPQLGPRAIRVDATVASFGAEAAVDLPLTLRVDGKAVAKGLIDLPAHGRVVKRFFHVLDEPQTESRAHAGDGTDGMDGKQPTNEARGANSRPPPSAPEFGSVATHDLQVELPADALTDDDRRFARVQIRRELKALIVDGDPRTIRRDDEVFYLETALRPGDRDDSRIDVTVATLDDLTRGRLDDYDVVFVANVKAPDPVRAAALAAYVEKGGGLFLSVGDNVDPDAWNSAFGDLLPQPLQTLRTVGSTSRSRDDGEARATGEGEQIARFDRRHPVLAPFSPSGAGHGHGPADALREARVSRFVLLKPTPHPRDDEHQILLRLESGAPLLVEGRRGAGRVLLLTTTIDRDWSDLAIQPAFLPLVQQAARYLARAALREPDAPSLVGQAREITLSDGDQRVEVTTPSGAIRHFDPDRVSGRKTLSFGDTDEPGLYKVAAAGASSAPKPRPQLSFAVNVDPSESDFARIAPARLAELAHARPGAGGPPNRRRIELWHALGAALLGLLLVEGLLATRRA